MTQYIYESTSQKIKELKNSLPEILLQKQYEIQPELKKKYGERQIQFYLEDTRYHLSYLAESISANEPVLFNEYLAWAKTFFANLPVTDEEIIVNLELLRDTLNDNMPVEMGLMTARFINEGIKHYISQPTVPPSFITELNPLKQLANDYLNFLLVGNKKDAHEIIMQAVKSGTSIKDIYINVFQVTQKETGRLWQLNKVSVAQEHFITAATQLIMSQLYPYLFNSSIKKHKIIVACIAGELHEIGARMVADLFELDGWDSYYYGANTPRNSLISAIQTYKPDVLAISATMTFNLSSVSELINSVRDEATIKDVKILVGGYPFMIADKLWQKMGADGFASDAVGAIKLADELLK